MGWVGLGHLHCGSGRVGSKNLDPCPTLRKDIDDLRAAVANNNGADVDSASVVVRAGLDTATEVRDQVTEILETSKRML